MLQFTTTMRKITLALLAFQALFLLAILVASAIVKSNLKVKYPPLGEMVDVGGYKLHLYCLGSGDPTVVMESGSGETGLSWALVQPEIARLTRTCVYDRAGYGWSEASPKPRTGIVIVEELHTLLQEAGIQGPVVLVGHSYGGLLARMYAHQYPDQVAGLVLVDANHEALRERMAPALRRAYDAVIHQQIQSLKLSRRLIQSGLAALYPALYPAHPLMPKEAVKLRRSLAVSDVKMADAVQEELQALETTTEQARQMQITDLGEVPLVVLRRGLPEPPPSNLQSIFNPALQKEMEALWAELQEELASLSSNGKLVAASQSGHYIQLEQPEMVIDAIRLVLGR